jgi:hypothetical protein
MPQRFVEEPTRKLNRLKSRAPKTGKSWCACCDAYQTGQTERCRVCGCKGEPNKLHRREIP